MSLDVATTSLLSPAEILRWYADMGVDIAIDEAPHDRFAQSEALQQSAVAARPTPAEDTPRPPRALPSRQNPAPLRPVAVSSFAQASIATAQDMARAAPDLESLRVALQAFEGCALKATATNLVFADGNPKARLMLVGEAPGADEDRQGLPFIGSSGRLLDKMLAAIGLDRTLVYIANIIPWRPPGNRTPSPQEVALCLPFIARQIELVNPGILVCLGGSPAKALLGIKDGIMQARGKWFDYACEGRNIRALAALHPAYLLRATAHKRLAWNDWREVRKALDEGA